MGMVPVSKIYSKRRQTVASPLCLISVAAWTQSQNSRSPSHLLLVWEVQCPSWIGQRFGETSESAHLILSCLSWSGAASTRASLPSRQSRLASDRADRPRRGASRRTGLLRPRRSPSTSDRDDRPRLSASGRLLASPLCGGLVPPLA